MQKFTSFFFKFKFNLLVNKRAFFLLTILDFVSGEPGCWQVLSPTRKETSFGSISGKRAISTARCELSSSFFLFLQGKAPKEIHAILTLACFLPGRAEDLSAPLVHLAYFERGTKFLE
jgi:hypothetical protein